MTEPRFDWLDETTSLFLDTLDGLADPDLDAATRLPGWTRRHVVAHVHFNALALERLVSWARTGHEAPMYASQAQRTREIEDGVRWPVPRLRAAVHESARMLRVDFNGLGADDWQARVVTAQGRNVAATEIVWLRIREVAVHAVDLVAGTEFADLGEELCARLAADALQKRTAGPEAIGLAAWLTGRSAQAPELGRWL